MKQPTDYNILFHYLRERIVLPVRIWIYRYTRRVLIIFILALVANFLFSYFFYTPKMWALRQTNNEIVLKYELLNDKIKRSVAQLDEIRHRDNAVYRSIFSADTMTIEGVWSPYPDQKYASVGYGRYTPLIETSWRAMDAYARQLYAESMSLDEIEYFSKYKDAMAESVPAIWPVDRKKMRGHIGAFGSRVDPVYRYIARHQGIDLAAPMGTAIYATGNGTIVTPREMAGYGKQIMIDHGFGYKTRYAHLSKVLVAPGQSVKRGEKIGEMGSTGKSTGVHLHYEVIHRNVAVNPLNYLSRDMSEEEFRAIIQKARATTYE